MTDEVFMHNPVHYFETLVRPDYKEPEDIEEAKELIKRLEKIPGSRVKNQRPYAKDVYLGILDGFAYGSRIRIDEMKYRGVRKPPGPTDIYKRPPTDQNNYGFFLFDPALAGATWIHRDEYHPQPVSGITKFIIAARKANKFLGY